MKVNKDTGFSLRTFIAARKKSLFVTPGISCGYCMAKNTPAILLSLTGILNKSLPS